MKQPDAQSFEVLDQELEQKLKSRVQTNKLAQTLGFEIVEIRKDFCEITLDYREEITNGAASHGTIHGGIVASLVDVAGAYALATNFAGQMSFATVDLHINFLNRALTKICARAYVIRKGRRINVVEADVYDADNKPVAKAILNFILTKEMEFK